MFLYEVSMWDEILLPMWNQGTIHSYEDSLMAKWPS